jgi:hypothetical protein
MTGGEIGVVSTGLAADLITDEADELGPAQGMAKHSLLRGRRNCDLKPAGAKALAGSLSSLCDS